MDQHASSTLPSSMLDGADDMIPEVIGHIDGIDLAHAVFGWFKLRHHDSVRLSVRIHLEGVVATETTADLPREDVAGAGHGDGCYGFSLPLPRVLFDGAFHQVELRLSVENTLLPDIFTFGAILPKLPDQTDRISAQDIKRLQQSLFPPNALQQSRNPAFRKQLAAIIADLAVLFGPAVAVDMLYIYVLGRPADNSGLTSAVEHLRVENGAARKIVDDVFGAQEFIDRRGTSYLAELSVLECWRYARAGMYLG